MKINSLDNYVEKHNLTKTEEEKLHRYISYQNYTYHEIEELIFELFGK